MGIFDRKKEQRERNIGRKLIIFMYYFKFILFYFLNKHERFFLINFPFT